MTKKSPATLRWCMMTKPGRYCLPKSPTQAAAMTATPAVYLCKEYFTCISPHRGFSRWGHRVMLLCQGLPHAYFLLHACKGDVALAVHYWPPQWCVHSSRNRTCCRRSRFASLLLFAVSSLFHTLRQPYEDPYIEMCVCKRQKIEDIKGNSNHSLCTSSRNFCSCC